MLWRCFWAALALMLGADATLPGANADQTKVVFGKVLSLDLQDDGTGTLTALVRRPARVPLRPKEMTFQVTKETQFLTRSGRAGEGAVVAPGKVVDTFKKDTPVTVRYTEEAGRLARTVSTSASLPTSDGDGKEGKSPDNKAAEGKHLKILGRASWRPAGGGDRGHRVIRSSRELPGNATALAKEFKVDAIDWKTQMVLVISGGTQRTGGYSVGLTDLTVEGKTLTAHWQLRGPRPGQMVTQALTHPAAAFLVERFEGEVRFAPPTAPGGSRRPRVSAARSATSPWSWAASSPSVEDGDRHGTLRG